MRTLLAILISITFLGASLGTSAQTHLPIGTWGLGSPQWQTLPLNTQPGNLNFGKKWQLRPYAGLSAGYIFLNGGISYLSAPLGLTLYRPLTNNVTAFAGVSATPLIFSVNSLYGMPRFNPANNFSNGYGLGINAAVGGGLIYTNDAHTFSISGSVWMERGSYPVYPTRTTDNTKR
ncbi:hypothetical protein [Puia sp.]|jgi:hypothetical protein|uniref:hypothetical protein n=1 Tax=Puia sp. TaxID=2045100 RepID=UPI002F415FCE